MAASTRVRKAQGLLLRSLGLLQQGFRRAQIGRLVTGRCLRAEQPDQLDKLVDELAKGKARARFCAPRGLVRLDFYRTEY
jgi:hypothetical protein